MPEEPTKNEAVATKSDVALAEEKVLAFWKENKIFEKTLEKKSPKGDYVFYDGPPFATGLPHYGHILASTIKDAVPRYQTMKGMHVERKWGWDCHGLPIENIVEKDLKVSGRKEIEALGVKKFNEYARSKVLDYVSHWKETVDRMGRWVDFDGSYKTMDNTFIESVWWALKSMWDKGLVYEGTRVLPYCPRCETPIANSEIAMDNSYKDITDISVYVKLELINEPSTFLLAWTTTPWTLPGNTAAAVNPELEYVKVKAGDEYFIFAKAKLETISKLAKDQQFEVVEEIMGNKLVGLLYKPLFDYFINKNIRNKENGWKVYAAPYVTAETGTGIVHLAPGYGEEDMALAKELNIPFVLHVGHDGKFTADVTDFVGQKAKPKEDHQAGDVLIIKNLAHKGLLFAKEKIIHSYPHCFRCETPLYYFAIPAWFIKISDVKDRLLALNEKIHWVPDHLKHGRFAKSMEGAPDWNISRNRYWASPLPIWKCDACQELEFIGSLGDLKKHSGTSGNKFFLVRHGESESNKDGGRISTRLEVLDPLTVLGEKQAAKAGSKLKKEKIDVIITSPFSRAKETAKIIAKEIGFTGEIIEDARIGEIQITDWDGKTWDECLAFYSDRSKRFERLPENANRPENWEDVRMRAAAFMYDMDKKYAGKNIIIVAHGGPLNLICLSSKGLSPSEIIVADHDHAFENGEVEEINWGNLPHNDRFEIDIHRPYIDDVVFPCACGKGTMKRISEVIDCWFESGSMPFAQHHYPFENKKKFEENFPAQFITEYIAQTRTWFYYTHAVSTMLFNDIAFQNVVTTGTVLAEDGEKMSKSKGNFPDPWILFNKYGVDAIRFYLLSSPLMKSEDLNFSEKGVDEVYKKIVLRLKNTYSFYEMYQPKADQPWAGRAKSSNVLDHWIFSRLAQVTGAVTLAMDAYEIEKALAPIADFIEDLSVWYLRRSRDRLKSEDEKEKTEALGTFRHVLVELVKVMAPFTPFLSEELYKKMNGPSTGSGQESVHLEDWPKAGKVDKKLLDSMQEVRKIVSLGLEARSRANIKVRQPLQALTIKSTDENKSLEKQKELLALILDEVNVKEIIFDKKLDQDVSLDTTITLELKSEGDMRDFIRFVQELRKEMNLNPHERVTLVVQTDTAGQELLKKFEKEISKVTGATQITFENNTGKSVDIGELKFVVSIQK